MLTVTFLKSDAMHDRFPSEPDELAIELTEAAQLTYGLLRSTANDTDLAILDQEGDWLTRDPLPVGHWSDVVLAIGAPDGDPFPGHSEDCVLRCGQNPGTCRADHACGKCAGDTED